jgi:hypothetical protein
VSHVLSDKDRCSNCKTVPYPRGFEPALGLCWHCVWTVRPWKQAPTAP